MTVDTLRLLLPELILVVTGLVVITIDLITAPAHQRRGAGRCVRCGPAAGCAGCVYHCATSTPQAVTDMLAVDGFATFLMVAALIGMALVVLYSLDYMRKYGTQPWRILRLPARCGPGHRPGRRRQRPVDGLPGDGVPLHHLLRAGRLPARRCPLQRGAPSNTSSTARWRRRDALRHLADLRRNRHARPRRHSTGHQWRRCAGIARAGLHRGGAADRRLRLQDQPGAVPPVGA